MNEKMTFKAIRVPESLMEDMKVLKRAFEESYGKKMTFEDVLRQMIASIEDDDPSVYEIYCTMQNSRQEMQEKINALKLHYYARKNQTQPTGAIPDAYCRPAPQEHGRV